MEKKKVNQCIGCSVTNCKYNSPKDQYCTLERIQVGTHEQNPTMDQCTDCQSFMKS